MELQVGIYREIYTKCGTGGCQRTGLRIWIRWEEGPARRRTTHFAPFLNYKEACQWVGGGKGGVDSDVCVSWGGVSGASSFSAGLQRVMKMQVGNIDIGR